MAYAYFIAAAFSPVYHINYVATVLAVVYYNVLEA